MTESNTGPGFSPSENRDFFEKIAPRIGNAELLIQALASLDNIRHRLEEGKKDLLAPLSEAYRSIEAVKNSLCDASQTVPPLASFALKNGKIINLKDALVHGLSHTLHYGDGVFEGIRFYKTAQGSAIFRLKEHVDRLLYSARVLEIDVPWKKEVIEQGIIEIVRENLVGDASKHFPRGEGYIRPILVRGPEKQGLSPTGAKTSFLVFCWDMGDYIKSDLIDISLSSYKRIHPQTTVSDAKICGHYVNSILAALELKKTGAHEAILLDCEGRIAEGPGENLFIVKGGTIFTPSLGNILAGITRDSIIQLAKAERIEVVEGDLDINDLLEADEAFFTGTAAEVKPIRALNGEKIGDGSLGLITAKLKETYSDVVHGRNQSRLDWLTFIS